MLSPFRLFVLLPVALLTLVSARGQGLDPAVPLVRPDRSVPAPSEGLRTLAAAKWAQELGLPSLAATLYRQLLSLPDGAGVNLAQITLDLATALLDDGDIAGAEKALQSQPAAQRDAAWHLRAGLIAAYRKNIEGAKAELAAAKREDLVPQDAGWWLFLQGMLANLENNTPRALDFYGQAAATARSEMSRARFLLAQDQARLKLGTVTDNDVEEARKRAANNQGKSIDYAEVGTYATYLDVRGNKSQALDVVQRQLRSLPPDEHGAADNFRLLLGLIAGAEDGVGRNALGQLLATGSDREKQRKALQLLAGAARTGAARADFHRRLDELIEAPTASGILEDLLAVRAQFALADRNYPQAEKDAKELLEKFPGSQLKAQALAVLTQAAWERGFYRNAADYATKARAELGRPDERETRAELGVLIAEAYFRAEDFRSAADAYGAVLAEPPGDAVLGVLMFQRVLAEIRAANFDGSRLEAVAPLLDGLAGNPAFDPVNRWKAEWTFAHALEAAGDTETAAAYARVNHLLASLPPGAAGASAGPPPALPADLRARMEWLRAQLSLEAGQPEQALKFADELSHAVDGLDPQLKAEILSTMLLLEAKADFALAKDAPNPEPEKAALKVLDQLVADYPDSNAAQRSYIDQADYFEKQNNIVDAQRRLTDLVGKFPKSVYAPLAAYRAAEFDEKLGRDTDAIKRLEQLITDYPQSDLVFDARLKEGNLYMNRNEFSQAQKIYEAILEKYPKHEDELWAELALAKCHAAQAAADESHADRARDTFDRLLALQTAPPDLRVQAGFNLGNELIRRGDTGMAETVWWRDVVSQFLLERPEAAARLGTQGRYWMTCTLLAVGDLFKSQGRQDDAKRAWMLIISSKLGPGAENEAREKLGLKPAEPLL